MFKNNLNYLTPPEKISLPDGTELRLCKRIVSRTGNRKLYCSKAGLFYSLSTRGLNQIKCYHVKNFKAKPNVHSYYPRMCGFIGNPYCHLLVAFAWVGPGTSSRLTGGVASAEKGIKMECHHLNGNICDNRASNLIWLTHTDHRRFDAALRQGLVLERQDPDARMEYEMTHHLEF